jgi:hypothetical protein
VIVVILQGFYDLMMSSCLGTLHGRIKCSRSQYSFRMEGLNSCEGSRWPHDVILLDNDTMFIAYYSHF